MRGNRYNTVDRNFDGAVPPTNGGNSNLAEIAKARMEEQNKKREELKDKEKARAVEFAKKRALVNTEKSNESPKNEAPDSKTPNIEKPNESEIQAEEKPEGKKLVWNPNSKYAGFGRVIQHVKPLKKVSDTILSMGNRYTEDDFMEEDNYAGFMSMVSKIGSKTANLATKGINKVSTIANKTISKVGSQASKVTNNISKVAKVTPSIPKTDGIVHSAIPMGVPKPSIPNQMKTLGTGTVNPVTKPNLPSTEVNKVTNGPLGSGTNSTTYEQRMANRANNRGLTTKSNVLSTARGVLNSKFKSAVVMGGVGAGVAAANGKSPVAGAVGGAAGGVALSSLSKNYSFIDGMPSIINTETSLIRDKLIAAGYSKELSIIDKTESKERKIDRAYTNAKKVVSTFLNGQRTDKVNLKGNRAMLLKKLSNPNEDKLYSSLSLLYFHCENSQI